MIFSGLTLYAEHKTIAVTPQGATLTKKAPGTVSYTHLTLPTMS